MDSSLIHLFNKFYLQREFVYSGQDSDFTDSTQAKANYVQHQSGFFLETGPQMGFY